MENINIDFTDYKTILSYEGKITGIVDTCKLNDFFKIIDKPLKKSLSKAKGILINFKLHETQTLILINDFMSKIYDIVNSKVDITFSTEQTKDIEKDEIAYQIIITGLK